MNIHHARYIMQNFSVLRSWGISYVSTSDAGQTATVGSSNEKSTGVNEIDDFWLTIGPI
jgi:hypothetical protein